MTYNDATWLARRHGLGPESAAAVTALEKVLPGLVAKATG